MLGLCTNAALWARHPAASCQIPCTQRPPVASSAARSSLLLALSPARSGVSHLIALRHTAGTCPQTSGAARGSALLLQGPARPSASGYWVRLRDVRESNALSHDQSPRSCVHAAPALFPVAFSRVVRGETATGERGSCSTSFLSRFLRAGPLSDYEPDPWRASKARIA